MAYPSTKGTKKGEKASQPHAGVPLCKKTIAELIKSTRGNLSEVADRMGTSRGCVRRVIDGDEALKECLTDARERWIDRLEKSVWERAEESNDTGLQAFLLKTQGRHRGYDQSEAQHMAKDIATAAFDFIINKSKNPAESK